MTYLSYVTEKFADQIHWLTSGQIIGGCMYYIYPLVDPNFQVKVEIFDCNPENPTIAKIRLNDQIFDSRSKAKQAFAKMVEPLFRKAILMELS